MSEFDPFGDPAPPAPVPPLVSAVATGDQRASLVAMRDHVAKALESCRFAKDMAPLARELREILAEIAKLPDVNGKADPVDELAEQRAERRRANRATAAGS